MVSITVSSNTASAGIVKYKAGVLKALIRALGASSDKIVSDAKETLIWNHGRSTGKLADSISGEVKDTGNNVEVSISAKAPYAKYVEEGTRRHFVPFTVAPEYRIWLLSHGVNLAANAKGYMAANKALHFMKNSFNKNAPRVLQTIINQMNAVKV